MTSERAYPELPDSGLRPGMPISFVVVRYSNEYKHNFQRSECVNNPLNEVIEVNNTANLFFDNLSQAMSDGIRKTRNELIVVVHEDVRLVTGWQVSFEHSLMELEKHDDKWGVVGSVGWTKDGVIQGHWSDPYGYKNTFKGTGRPYIEVDRLDEQILILHKGRLPVLDEMLPGIHHIGRDLSLGMRNFGRKTYAIDAPTIHKYRDKDGQLVLSHETSEKIQDRKSRTYLADKACCDNYIAKKWPELSKVYRERNEFQIPFSSASKLSQLEKPIILLSRGGSGSRLLSNMVEQSGVFLGNELNRSGDTMELVNAIYRAIVEKYRCRSEWQKEQAVPRIMAAAAKMIEHIPADTAWGFKLPESLLVLPELGAAFPGARYVHLVRDPVATCLRRTHMTARLDNHIGRISLPLAYDYFNIDRSKILEDSPALHMAYTTAHQLDLVGDLSRSFSSRRFYTIRFEDVITQSRDETVRLCAWLDIEPKNDPIEDKIDINRANNPSINYPDSVVSDVNEVLSGIRIRMGYLNPE